MVKLILIRHGQTNYNLKKRYCGFRDININKTGRLQSKEIKYKLKGLKIDKIFCSDLKRSMETARIIFGKKHNLIISPDLREINFGEWEGLAFKQICKKHSLVYKNWVKNPFATDIPCGENMDSFIKRVNKEIKDIVNNNADKTVAVVSHLGPIRVILNACSAIKKDNFWKMQLDPQGVYIVEYNGCLRPKVQRL